VPSEIVQCLSTFMDLCYIFRRNAITATALKTAESLLDKFHDLRRVFVDAGVRSSTSLPRQHSLLHYITSIPLFGSPNGLCSSITESKHIKAVKEPWRRSSRYKALIQMLRTITRLDKIAALRRVFVQSGMLVGTTSSYITQLSSEGGSTGDSDDVSEGATEDEWEDDNEEDDQENLGRLRDAGPVAGPQALSSITLAATSGTYSVYAIMKIESHRNSERKYPRNLDSLAQYINQPEFPQAFKEFLFSHRHPTRPIPDDINNRVHYSGKIQVFHSAVTRFYAPSDLCGAGGMYRQRIRCNPSWYGHPRHDTVFVVQDKDEPGMQGMLIARLHLLFSFVDSDDGEVVPCALVSWFILAQDHCDPDTGMWVVKPEGTRALRPVQVIPLKSIARGSHLLPKYGTGPLPDSVSHINALDAFQFYFVNSYIDHHCHEFLLD
jgi:hypothetical protein